MAGATVAASMSLKWREQLRDCLKKWEPEFADAADLIKKKRRVKLGEDTTVVSLDMQVDPGMI